ncbi:hypothetical protein K2Y11_00930 [bacterium]|nr:hypothetical protein [bacterium]
MKRNVQSDIARHPYREAASEMLVEKWHPDCDVADLLSELRRCEQVVEIFIQKYGDGIRNSDRETPPESD